MTLLTRARLGVGTFLATPPVWTTRATLKVAATGPTPPRNVSRVSLSFAGAIPTPFTDMTRVTLRVLYTQTPNFEMIPVIKTDVFPYDISYNSVGSTRFATDVIVVDSGDDQRMQRWDQPLMEYDVAYGVRTMEQLMALITFFRAMRGRTYAFNYRDNVDYTSSIPTAFEARAAPTIGPYDQWIGTGDGSTTVFQLQKTYQTLGGTSQVRPITRPEPGTVAIGVNGSVYSHWTVDNTTGLVTFTSPFQKQFTGGLTVGAKSGSTGQLEGNPGDFSVFTSWIGRRIMTSGFANGANNVPPTQVATIASVATDGSYLVVSWPNTYGGVAETTAGTTITIHPAPVSGWTLTAGFQFYVPCRFDTDILPVTIEDYGIGGSNSVKLIEVRPTAW